MLKTMWVEPGDGATIRELVEAMGGLAGASRAEQRTSRAIVGEGRVIFDAYDRIRAIEALERVGVRVGEGKEVVVAEAEARPGEPDTDDGPNLYNTENQPTPFPWPDLAEKLLSAAQAVVNDAETDGANGPLAEVRVPSDTFRWLTVAVQAVHNEAVKVIERERGRNR